MNVRRESPLALTLVEHRLDVPLRWGSEGFLVHLERACEGFARSGLVPIRIAISETGETGYACEVGLLRSSHPRVASLQSIFEFRRRLTADTEQFTTALIVPTGIGAAIGGHAGDAGPVSRLLSQVSDRLIIHPNVVNASDVNEMPEDALYVEGSVLTRLLMGSVGLQPVRANRLLVVIDNHSDGMFVNAAINTVNGARAAYGLACDEIVCLEPPMSLRGHYAASGRATGEVAEAAPLLHALESRRGSYDAVAISSIVAVPEEFHQEYFDAGGEMVNPWGGVEALLTHAISSLFDIPAAHSPMLESQDIANADPGIVDPRMAAEAVSTTFLQCILKGLQRSPRVVTTEEGMAASNVITAADISCVVIPAGCLGLPTLAALEQGIVVIAVGENTNLMKNDLARLPWAPGQFFAVDNYWEAAGVIAAIRAGIEPLSVRRPLPKTMVTFVSTLREYGDAMGRTDALGRSIVAGGLDIASQTDSGRGREDVITS